MKMLEKLRKTTITVNKNITGPGKIEDEEDSQSQINYIHTVYTAIIGLIHTHYDNIRKPVEFINLVIIIISQA